MKLFDWFLFISLCIIWGSSFVLMKEGMIMLSPYQVASLRLFSAGIILLPFAYSALKKIPRKTAPVVILAGFTGSFFPSYLFCIAETKIDSSLAGILNALTPLFTIVIGMMFFKMKAGQQKVMGVAIGFVGLLLLFTSNGKLDTTNLSYTSLVLLATLMYGINVNIIGSYLKDIGSFNIGIIAFSFLTIPSMIILIATGYFNLNLTNEKVLWSTGASIILGIFGTAIANIMFYMLLKRSGALFASMVTYGIPLVAVIWGVLYGEQLMLMQVISMFIILVGVYLANRNKKAKDLSLNNDI